MMSKKPKLKKVLKLKKCKYYNSDEQYWDVKYRNATKGTVCHRGLLDWFYINEDETELNAVVTNYKTKDSYRVKKVIKWWHARNIAPDFVFYNSKGKVEGVPLTLPAERILQTATKDFPGKTIYISLEEK